MPRFCRSLLSWGALLLVGALACTPVEFVHPVTVYSPQDAADGLKLAVADLVSDLRAMEVEVTEATLPGGPCVPREIAIVVLGHEHFDEGEAAVPAMSRQELRIDEKRCGTGRRYVVRGGSLLAGQWAVYELLHRAGVRYWHPEQTFYPDKPSWPEQLLQVRETPFFQSRTLQLHRTHPVELSAPLEVGELDMAGYQKRWIDWNVKIRSTAVNGWDPQFAGTHAYIRGFPRWVGFNLLNTQQGMTPVIDPDDRRPETEQIAAAIEREMRHIAGLPDPEVFSFQFNPSEFTEVDAHETVARLTFIANHFAEHYPDVKLFTINHGTHGEPTDYQGARFFDLSKFAPANLGVKVHTLMFYDLERPAPVYGNEDFSYLLEFIREESSRRPIVHYPETNWWLTFDIPVPLYLAPATLEARQYDLDLIADLVVDDETLPSGVQGHRLFTSGHEWGYWLVDYCAGRMTWDRYFTHEDCIDDFTAQFAEGATLARVFRQVEARQVTDLRNPDILRFLVGSDDATETAYSAGIVFHPLPPRPEEVLRYDDEQIGHLESRSLFRLKGIAADYHAWADEVEAALPVQGERQAPWVREIRDGLRAFALKAEHAVAVYETVRDLRAALNARDLAAVDASYEGLEKARAITERARAVVRARENDYRYPPELTIAGDEAGSEGAIPNRTVYPYRYLSRTHRLFYFERPNAQLAELYGEGLELVQPNRRVLVSSEPLAVSLLAEDVEAVQVSWGDGTNANDLEPHLYTSQGFFDWSLTAETGTGVVHHTDSVAVVSRRFVFPKGSLKVREPAAAVLLEGMLPGFVVGTGEDENPFMALGRLDVAGDRVAARGSLLRRSRSGNVSPASDLAMFVQGVGDVVVKGAELELEDVDSVQPRLWIRGEMSTGGIVDLLVEVGGFNREGARKLVADVLGATPDTLPAYVDFRLEARGASES